MGENNKYLSDNTVHRMYKNPPDKFTKGTARLFWPACGVCVADKHSTDIPSYQQHLAGVHPLRHL